MNTLPTPKEMEEKNIGRQKYNLDETIRKEILDRIRRWTGKRVRLPLNVHWQALAPDLTRLGFIGCVQNIENDSVYTESGWGLTLEDDKGEYSLSLWASEPN